jgi:hypothetical protein
LRTAYQGITNHKEIDMKNADYARAVLADMEDQVKSAKKRKTMAAFFASNVAGKLSPEAVEVYRAYAEGK